MKKDKRILKTVEIFSNHYIERFKQLMEEDRKEDALSIAQEYIDNGDVENDNYQWFYVNYQFNVN